MISLTKVPVGLLTVGVLVLVACGGEEEVDRSSNTFTPVPTLSDVASTREMPTETSAAPGPTARRVRTAETRPTTAPDTTPAPLPPSKLPGYLHGTEHGIALLRTTRAPSETRDGWVDIALMLATTKFAGDIEDRDANLDEHSFCYLNSRPPHDCLLVAWGSEEQFEAELGVKEPFLLSKSAGWPDPPF